MKCPVDSGRTDTYDFMKPVLKSTKLENCGGNWFGRNELERIQNLSERDYTEEIAQLSNLVDQAYAVALAKQNPPVNCPSCNGQMERKEQEYCSQCIIDTCP
ncbi:hypothetical protein [Planctomycetes bacterium K23_9]|uniref:Uncharacterized protein n=1 Tax=Stieleria marina TaxID=1930275 RepID=A0A517P072_9BACT|nr:hypothetical protein K239x_47760 [Planctomycetes bacterium K23_9]